MNKVAITYWDNPRTISLSANRRANAAKPQTKTNPQWFVFAVIAAMTLMLCTAINLRAFSELSEELEQHERLNLAVEQLNNENIGLQTEVHSLKTDKFALEREARKMGMSRPNEKVLVPMN